MAEVLKILQAAQQWLQAGDKVYLFHVAQTWGSSPRPVGSLLAVNDSGQHIGSVSGGCVEADLFKRIANKEFTEQPFVLIEYSNESHPHISLPCRGQMQILLEILNDVQILEPIIKAIESRKAMIRHVDIKQQQIRYLAHQPGGAKLENNTLTEPYGPSWRVLLIGANDLAEHVTRQCQALDYEIIISEPRDNYRLNWSLPNCELTGLMPDEAVDKYIDDKFSAVLALSHDPRLDDLAIIQALDSPAFYLGALGSRRSVTRRIATMRKMGISEQQIERLDAPIGINIGSRSPAEIAVAIAARLIQVRNTHTTDIQHDLLQHA